MKISKEEYDKLSRQVSPKSKLWTDCLWAFFVGGTICLIGEGLRAFYQTRGFILTDASALASVTLVVLSAILTSLGWYQKIASKAGAGTLVPITGFANAVVAPAMEFRSEGLVLGMSGKLFTIAGPVLVFGISASVVLGIILYLAGLAG